MLKEKTVNPVKRDFSNKDIGAWKKEKSRNSLLGLWEMITEEVNESKRKT